METIRQTLISKDIINFKNTLDAYIYSIIKMNSNYYNGQSAITYPKIAQLSDIPESTIRKHLSRKDNDGKYIFKDNPLFLNWEYFYVDSKTHIRYRMNTKPENYFILRNDFILDKSLTPKEKDFLLRFMAICTNGTHYLKASKRDIQDKVGVGKNNPIIDSLINKGYMVLINGYYIIRCKGIPLSRDLEKANVYQIIEDFCIGHGIIPPVYDRKKINLILSKYTTNGKDNRQDFKQALIKKCKHIEQGNYQYLLTALGLYKKEVKSYSKPEDNIIIL
jgi:hypothetical protein